jgi:hypothetical protein
MFRILKIVLMLNVAIFYQVSAGEYKPLWHHKISGTYEGEILNEGYDSPAVTKFEVDQSGVIHGEYAFTENADWVFGKLFDCKATRARQLQCRWQDKYGIGLLSVMFSKDVQSFKGVWDIGNTITSQAYWNGRRVNKFIISKFDQVRALTNM